MALRACAVLLVRKGDAFASYGWDRCGNRYSPLRLVPDWEHLDGTPAPQTRRYMSKMHRLALYKAQVLVAAEAANYYAQSGKLPARPTIRRQRMRDVQVTDETPEQIWERKKQQWRSTADPPTP
eukprot:EG_transcript_33059